MNSSCQIKFKLFMVFCRWHSLNKKDKKVNLSDSYFSRSYAHLISAHNLIMQRFREVYPRDACMFLVHTQAFRRGIFHSIPRKSVASLFYTMRKKLQWLIQSMRHAHNVKVECNTVEYTKVFLCSDLLYFLWHGINTRILVQRQECLIKLRLTN